ncbi:MAG: DUF499 domain-containing protein, partial [Caldilinea sp.]|nr:DUF499 domain-containing protein [Caldilinea sp.]
MTKGAGDDRAPVAPVDLSQAIIGPGMAVFSKYAAVLEADGTPMSVRVALQLINRFLAEDDFDADTQFCLHWFDQYGWAAGPFGEADVLARAKGTSVGSVQAAGVVETGGGKVRLRRWTEYPADWDPQKDSRIPVWEALHQLIRVLKEEGEHKAGELLTAVAGDTCAESIIRSGELSTMKPWREVIVPHTDVLEGTFQQAEFAADLTAVHLGRATREYQEPSAFFQRTFITEGMRLLLIQVMQRLNGVGGEPVIQLQTAFGGGKTHGMMSVYHLATRHCPLSDLEGIPSLLDQAALMDIPRARVAVLDGHAYSPGQPWQHGRQRIHTLWGELAWQLGGEEGFQQVKDADSTGTSPGKEILSNLLARYAPCVVLIDELVAYVRQFPDGQRLSGGTFDSNLSFVQALTEACKLVPNAMILASLPESEVEAGGERGMIALRALEKTFGRV